MNNIDETLLILTVPSVAAGEENDQESKPPEITVEVSLFFFSNLNKRINKNLLKLFIYRTC